jgi:hypothetical protein
MDATAHETFGALLRNYRRASAMTQEELDVRLFGVASALLGIPLNFPFPALVNLFLGVQALRHGLAKPATAYPSYAKGCIQRLPLRAQATRR